MADSHSAVKLGKITMNEDKFLKDKFGNSSGWRVPEGYFESLPERVVAALPAEDPKPVVTFADLSRWQKIKPYVYLAAMFAGIWLMVNMFTRVSGLETLSLDNPPENIAMIMAEHDPADLFVGSSSAISDIDLEMEVGSAYESIEDFEADFGYALRPEYVNMKI